MRRCGHGKSGRGRLERGSPPNMSAFTAIHQVTSPVSAPSSPDRGFPVWMRLLEAATQEVFESMLGEQAAPAVYAEDDRPPVADFTALVGLSGALNGSLSVRCQSDTAYEMGDKMLDGAMNGHDE